jgi:hypothetical protein
MLQPKKPVNKESKKSIDKAMSPYQVEFDESLSDKAKFKKYSDQSQKRYATNNLIDDVDKKYNKGMTHSVAVDISKGVATRASTAEFKKTKKLDKEKFESNKKTALGNAKSFIK